MVGYSLHSPKQREINMGIGLTPIEIDGENYTMASMLDTTNQILKISAYNDELTGLPNRSLFAELSEAYVIWLSAITAP